MNCLIAFATVLVFFSILGGLNAQALIAGLSVFIICGAGNVINDYYDREIDAENKPGRPIPSGEISAENALRLSSALFVAGNALSAVLGFFPFVFSLGVSSLLIFYAKRSKEIGLSGNVICAFATSSIILYAGMISHEFHKSTLFIIPIFLLSLSREIVKDIEDMKGDVIKGSHTLALKAGTAKAAKIASVMLFACLIAALFIIVYVFPKGTLFLTFIGCSYAALKAFDELMKNPAKHAVKVQKIQKAMMILLLSGFVTA